MSDEQKLFEDTKIKNINIDAEMKNSFLEYAMSVIVTRALPDVRDGLKPVHRRIIYAMYNSGFTAGKPYKKCARIVGDVLGRYHPHGDTAVYDSLVRMAQNFSLRYMLIDGQGNFGSVDGDSAAAMRYTEARMSKISMELVKDLEKETVEWAPNFDESLTEPLVLPTRLPSLLLNGSSGIAVGMATNIPPHNLNELSDGVCALIDNPELEGLELMNYIKGPDFPTGGIICGEEGIRKAYLTGKGSVVIRSKTSIEESKKKNKKAIIVHEIPYQVNKANLIIKIAELVQDKKITGISDLRDESDRKGLRIYIELKKDAIPDVILNQLFKHTQLQVSFGVNTVALVNGVPKTLTLKKILSYYILHRKEVVTKRTEYDLKNAKARLHILEGLKIALDNIDEIIALIKKSTNTIEARSNLMSKFNLSEKQSNAILDMKLQRLTGLEREKIESEYTEIMKKIEDLEDILVNEPRIYNIIKEEQLEVKDKYGDKRKTEISGAVGTMDIEDLIPKQQVAVLISKKGFIKRLPLHIFKSQLRGGRGVSGMTTREEDIIDQIFVTSSHNFLLCFTNKGKVFKIKCYQIPEASRQSKGVSISHFLNFDEEEKISTIIPVKNFDTEDYLLMTTQKGIVKKTAVTLFAYLKNSSIIAINLDAGDNLKWVKRTSGDKNVILSTSAGMVIRFEETQIRPMGRSTRGVKGINIKPEDNLTSMDVIDPEDNTLQLLIITKKGYGKNLKLAEFRCQKRGGIGVKCLKFRKTIKNDLVTDALITTKEDELMIATKEGVLCRQKIENISTQRRQSQGVKIQKLDAKDEVIAIARVITENEAISEEEPASTEVATQSMPLVD
ncbi:DNA gyrase subunit A [bacterium]|jgi:DNA gyrase subunit A|nr:DNA gyrase subunit A [bacterium]MBT3580833.1 DNA gyrase subunit A [bacterium]MBT4552399.1 DNA gyrase subunit A [bacterium]MBT7088462.1 DNA gyrase subunit A [bacterium]